MDWDRKYKAMEKKQAEREADQKLSGESVYGFTYHDNTEGAIQKIKMPPLDTVERLVGGARGDRNADRYFNICDDIDSLLATAKRLSIDEWNDTSKTIIDYVTAVYNTMLRICGIKLYEASAKWLPAHLVDADMYGNCLFDTIA